MTQPQTRRDRWEHYWTQTGVIPRWQLVAIYLVFIVVVIAGWQSVAHESKVRTNAIQQQRIDATRSICLAQNDRHDQAVRKTFELLGQPIRQPHPPLTQREKAAQRRQLEEWVTSLVGPKRDCTRVIAATVKKTSETE